MNGHPVPDPAAAKVLGAALRRVGYSEDAVHGMLGDGAYSIDREDVPVGVRRLPRSRVATVVRLLFLQLRTRTSDVVRALGRRGVEALEASGLAAVGADVVPCARVLPIGKLLLASDGYSHEIEDPPDYVAGYTPTSRLCDSLTPRPRVARALDVGTGSGIHALLAASHAERVVATDVNPRALAYTQLNAALNSVSNIEFRLGHLFEPVAGETFDLITCNAPYVVSPERRWAYRDGGLSGDEISQRVVREAAGHLAEEGFATLLVSWLGEDEDDPDARVVAWADATGCDSWILAVWDADPLEHAAAWNSHLAGDDGRFGDALDEWTRYLAEFRAHRVCEGAVILHRQRGPRHAVRVDSVDEEALGGAGEQIRRAFENRTRLGGLHHHAELLDARLSVAGAMRLERRLEPRGGTRAVVARTRIQLDDGTHTAVETTARAAEIVASLDGRARLRELTGGAGRHEVLDLSRELLELGALRFGDSSGTQRLRR